MTLAANIRLPGIYFLPPPPAETLGFPPLDVPAFVGFAQRGPLHLPVAVEDLAAYRAIFGGDLPVAQEAGGRTIFAHLPDAVQAFFANGGRRCYVVRVAGEKAERSRFHLPGMAVLDPESGEPIAPATVYAAWPGAWSGSLQLASQLRVTPLQAGAFDVSGSLSLTWKSVGAPGIVQTGDLLQLDVDGEHWLFPVSRIEDVKDDDAIATGTRTLSTTRVWRLVAQLDDSPSPLVTAAARLGLQGGEALDLTVLSLANAEDNGNGLLLTLGGPDAAIVKRGDLLRLEVDGDVCLFPVEGLGSRLSAPAALVQAHAEAMLALESGELPLTSPPTLERVNRLRFNLYSRQEVTRYQELTDLSFNDGHPRFWGEVVYLTSSELFRRSNAAPAEGALAGSTAADDSGVIAEAAQAYRALRTMAPLPDDFEPAALAALLAPIAGETRSDGSLFPLPVFLPLGMPTLFDEADFYGIDEEDERDSPVTALGDDDLSDFNPIIFLDKNLILSPGSSKRLLLEVAFDRYYRQGQRLRGLHGLTFIDDVALVALPDAVHRGWVPAPDLSLLGFEPWRMIPFDGTNFLICQGPPTVRKVTHAQGTTAGGTVVTISGSRFTESEQTEVAFGGVLGAEVTVLDSCTLTVRTPPRPSAGPVTVTVRNWNGEGKLIDGFHYTPAPEARLPLLDNEGDYDEEPLRVVQRCMLDFCQARTDLVAILTLPHHYQHQNCIDWLGNLRQDMKLPRLPVYSDDRRHIEDLSYGAVYHPWLLISDEDAPDGLRHVPADGVICGQIALREIQRQAWVAPANQPIQGVLGLEPFISREEWADLFAHNFNLVRYQDRAFRPLSAHTLSEERILLQLSVRRLMILLRKVAHQRGMDYVFESNTPAFRTSVRFALEELLQSMYQQGAFTGASPNQAFRVRTDTPTQAMERGQFIAQIQVAPSQPMEFITVLLLRVGQGALQAVES